VCGGMRRTRCCKCMLHTKNRSHHRELQLSVSLAVHCTSIFVQKLPQPDLLTSLAARRSLSVRSPSASPRGSFSSAATRHQVPPPGNPSLPFSASACSASPPASQVRRTSQFCGAPHFPVAYLTLHYRSQVRQLTNPVRCQ
jgi:hypothetical protein